MNDDRKNDGYELPQNCDFMQVSANSSSEVNCSPKLNDPFLSSYEGLLINAAKETIWPREVAVEDFTIFPDGSNNSPLRLNIAGLANLPKSTLGLDGDVAYEIVVVAVNQVTAESYNGKMIRMGEPGPQPLGVLPGFDESSAEPGVNMISTSYFNVDLVGNLNIPIAEATYTVYATLGDYKSNVLTINTRVK
ncbi:MAG: hypothetical protein GY820_05550 [Gammaproteobacteria bacterium]|nr:hypothetical protein [Gammaproteobacteria bacterium]